MGRRDSAAFAEFATARSSALFRAAYLMVGDHALAEDLLQEALTKTYVAWPKLRDINKAEAYTRKAITTTAISWWRRKSWQNEKPRGDVPERPYAEHGELVAQRDWLWTEGDVGTAVSSTSASMMSMMPRKGSWYAPGPALVKIPG